MDGIGGELPLAEIAGNGDTHAYRLSVKSFVFLSVQGRESGRISAEQDSARGGSKAN
jgi:hypothetical protein